MLLTLIRNYETLSPTQTVEQLKQDLLNPLFFKVMLATCSDTKYRLSPEQFQKFRQSKKALGLSRHNDVQPLAVSSRVWQVLEAMGSGDLSGDAAKIALTEACMELPEDDQEVILKIIDKTWRVGVTQDTVNLARPGTFRPAKFMLAHEVTDRIKKGKVIWPLLATIKYDGYRAIFCTDTDRGLSRNGNTYPLTEDLKAALRTLSQELCERYDLPYQPAIDGELFKGSWKATAEARKAGIGYDTLVVFGMLPAEMIYGGTSDEFNVDEFFEVVEAIIVERELGRWIATPGRRLVRNAEEMEAYFKEVLEDGFEGLVLTTPVRPYEGKRSYHWLKRKNEETEDLKITGAIMADARSKHAGYIGAVLVERNGVESGASGMSDKVRKQLTELHLDGHLKGLTAEIEYHELTPDGKLRHARVKTIRFDKVADHA